MIQECAGLESGHTNKELLLSVRKRSCVYSIFFRKIDQHTIQETYSIHPFEIVEIKMKCVKL